jgi:putative transposase
MCDVLDVSVSGYRAWRRGGTPNRKRLTDSQMRALIRALHAELKGGVWQPTQRCRRRRFPLRIWRQRTAGIQ